MRSLSIPAMLLATSAAAQSHDVDALRAQRTALAELTRVERDHAGALRRVRTADVAARRAEKTGSTAPRDGQKIAGVRNALHRTALAIVKKCDARIRVAVRELAAKDRDAFATAGLELVAEWFALSPPHRVRAAIASGLPTVQAAFRWQADEKARRRFLARVADLASRTPSRTDLEDLSEMIAWAALFHAELPRGRTQLRAVTKDLIVVLTDRDESGILRSKLGYYRPGRFLDSGFGEELRDGSDQVRHFIWALRAMVRSPNFAATEEILDLKERRDSVMRGVPIEKADLALNGRAREITAAMLGVKKGVAKKRRVPKPIDDLPGLVRDTLAR